MNKKQFKNKILKFFKNLDSSQLDQKEGMVFIKPKDNLKKYTACVGCWFSYIFNMPGTEDNYGLYSLSPITNRTKFKKYCYGVGQREFDTRIKKFYGLSDPKVIDILLHFSGAPEYPWSRDEWDEHPYTVLKRFFKELDR